MTKIRIFETREIRKSIVRDRRKDIIKAYINYIKENDNEDVSPSDVEDEDLENWLSASHCCLE